MKSIRVTADVKGLKHMSNKTQESTLYTIYGCKKSKSGDKLVITLVQGHDDDKVFINACVKLDKTGKVKARIDRKQKLGIVAIPLLTATKKQDVLDDESDF